MREYKVVYVDADYKGYIRYDGQKIEIPCGENESMQEAVLNHLARYGWRLVQAVPVREERFFLYMEREA